MSINGQITGADAVVRHVQRIETKAGPMLRATMERLAIQLQAHVQTHKLTGGDPLNVRTGRLRRSITYRVDTGPQGIDGIVGTNVEYAAIHEYGGTIVPKTAKWLTVPLRAALTPSGVMRYTKARDYPNTFIAKGFIMQRQAGGVVPLFQLRKSVKIPERSFLRSSLREMRPQIENGLRAALREAMR